MAAERIFARFAELLDIATSRAAAAWIRLNADGTVSERTAAETLADIGADTKYTAGTTFTGTDTVTTAEIGKRCIASITANATLTLQDGTSEGQKIAFVVFNGDRYRLAIANSSAVELVFCNAQFALYEFTWFTSGGWAPVTLFENPIKNKGDLLAGVGGSERKHLAVGANGTMLVADSAEQTGLKWITHTGQIHVEVGNGVDVITTGVKTYFRVPYGWTITGAYVTGSPSGSIVFDIWKNTVTTDPETDVVVGNTITASAKPTLSSDTYSADTTLTGWTTTGTAGQWMAVKVDSAATITKATLTLALTRT